VLYSVSAPASGHVCYDGSRAVGTNIGHRCHHSSQYGARFACAGCAPFQSPHTGQGYFKAGWITGIIVFVIAFIALAMTEETFGKDLNYTNSQ